jgi:hypothetical protein
MRDENGRIVTNLRQRRQMIDQDNMSQGTPHHPQQSQYDPYGGGHPGHQPPPMSAKDEYRMSLDEQVRDQQMRKHHGQQQEQSSQHQSHRPHTMQSVQSHNSGYSPGVPGMGGGSGGGGAPMRDENGRIVTNLRLRRQMMEGGQRPQSNYSNQPGSPAMSSRDQYRIELEDQIREKEARKQRLKDEERA